MNDPQKLAEKLLAGTILKDVPRSGWLVSGIGRRNMESVAAHSWGTTYITLLLCEALQKQGTTINLERALGMAVLHDLPELATSDIPNRKESKNWQELLKTKEALDVEFFTRLIEESKSPFLSQIVSEFLKKTSLESRIVVAADVLDMIAYAIRLEDAGVNPELLDQFFVSAHEKLPGLKIKIADEIFQLFEKKHKHNLTLYLEHHGISSK